jgi:hypothetical protein
MYREINGTRFNVKRYRPSEAKNEVKSELCACSAAVIPKLSLIDIYLRYNNFNTYLGNIL